MSPKIKSKQTAEKKFKVFILDDHSVVRHGLAGLINQEADLKVCGEAGDFHEALKSIKSSQPDIVIADLSLQVSSGIELIKMVKTENAKVLFLVHSMHDESLYAERALKAGARGYIMKQEAAENVVLALRQILQGQIYVSETMKSKLLQKVAKGKHGISQSPEECLSDRELEVFQWLGKGLRTGEIAKHLHRSVKTIESYRARIKEKLKLENSSELVRHAIQWANNRL